MSEIRWSTFGYLLYFVWHRMAMTVHRLLGNNYVGLTILHNICFIWSGINRPWLVQTVGQYVTQCRKYTAATVFQNYRILKILR